MRIDITPIYTIEFYTLEELDAIILYNQGDPGLQEVILTAVVTIMFENPSTYTDFIKNPIDLVKAFRIFTRADLIKKLFESYIQFNIMERKPIGGRNLAEFLNNACAFAPQKEKLIRLCSDLYLFARGVVSQDVRAFQLDDVKKKKLTDPTSRSYNIALIKFFHDYADIILLQNDSALSKVIWDFYIFLRNNTAGIDALADLKIPAKMHSIEQQTKVTSIARIAPEAVFWIPTPSATPAFPRNLIIEHKDLLLHFRHIPNSSPGLCLAESIGITNAKNILQEIFVQLKDEKSSLTTKFSIIDYLSRAFYNDFHSGQLDTQKHYFTKKDKQGRDIISHLSTLNTKAQEQGNLSEQNPEAKALQRYMKDLNVLSVYVEYLLQANYYNIIIGELLLNYPAFDLNNIITIAKVTQFSNGNFHILLADKSEFFTATVDNNDDIKLLPNPKVKWVLYKEGEAGNFLLAHYEELQLLEINPAVTNIPKPAAAGSSPHP